MDVWSKLQVCVDLGPSKMFSADLGRALVLANSFGHLLLLTLPPSRRSTNCAPSQWVLANAPGVQVTGSCLLMSSQHAIATLVLTAEGVKEETQSPLSS